MSWRKFLLFAFAFISFFFLIQNAFCYKIESDKDAVAYLTQFGYVDPDQMPLGFSLKDCNKKLKEFQKLANIRVSGELDKDTLKAMNTPRCGCPDFMHVSFNGNYKNRSGDWNDQKRREHTHRHNHHRSHRRHNHNNGNGDMIWRQGRSFGIDSSFDGDYFYPDHHNKNLTEERLSSYTNPVYRWNKPLVTYSISQYPTRYGLKVTATQIEEAIHAAFRIWEEYTNLEFRFEPNHVEADIELSFVSMYHGDNSPFDGPGNTLAHAFFPGTGIGGDVHFEEEEDWTVGTFGIDLLYVAVHEIGHSLGLGHSSEYGAIMYPMYRGYEKNLRLHSDDISRVQNLYGSKHRPPLTTTRPSPRPTSRRPSSTRETTTTPKPRPTTKKPTTTNPESDLCELEFEEGGIDAISTMLGDAIFVFKGENVYEIGKNGEGVLPGWPKKVKDYFPGLTGSFDAVITRSNGKTYFFKDAKYWRFTGRRMDRGYPRSMSEYFPGIPSNVDAAFEWDEEFVFTKGLQFWKFNTRQRPQVQTYFPMPLSHWGLSKKLDGVFTAPNSTIYFFQEEYFWEFDKDTHKVKNGLMNPSISSGIWFGCWEP